MEILERIEELRKKRNWSVYKLAEESGLTQSALSNMFSRKTMPSIATLTQLCEAFGISLAEFFNYTQNNLSTEESILISNFKKLSNEDKILVNNLIETIINSKNKKT